MRSVTGCCIFVRHEFCQIQFPKELSTAKREKIMNDAHKKTVLFGSHSLLIRWSTWNCASDN
jgi:hypothetical protein